MEKRPISESYWVEPGRFLAGEYPGQFHPEDTHQRINAFLHLGFDTFIDLTTEGEMPPYHPTLLEEARLYGLSATHQRFPIGDLGLPTQAGMTDILDTIDAALSAKHKVYLHCWGGIGRTGTTVGCYLARHGYGGDQALRQLAEWWRHVPKSAFHPRSPETEAQMKFVLHWME
jgi:hypothetical protein